MAFTLESGLGLGSNQARMGITCGLAELTAAAGLGKTDLSGKFYGRFYGRFYDGIRGDAGGRPDTIPDQDLCPAPGNGHTILKKKAPSLCEE